MELGHTTFNPEIGKNYHLFFSEGNPDNTFIHIRAIVDEDWIVFKQWSQRKGLWHYDIKPGIWFKLLANHSIIKQIHFEL